MFYPKLDEMRNKYQNYTRVPVIKEIIFDTETPISLVRRFTDSKYLVLLESVEGGEKWARYSFIGKNPKSIYRYSNNSVTIESSNGDIQVISCKPMEHIKELLRKNSSPKIQGLPRLTSGLVGYFSYDTIKYIETIDTVNKDTLEMPDVLLMDFDELYAFDHIKQTLQLIVNINPSRGEIDKQYRYAKERIKQLEHEIMTLQPNKMVYQAGECDHVMESNFSKEAYVNIVKKAKEYIFEGDIFQVVLSQRFKTKTSLDPFYVYRMLRGINPSPYMFFIKMDDVYLSGASPEMLLRVNQKRIVETCPIAGTRKRVRDIEKEKEIEKELLSDEKEIAEHTMLVDLGRNDIGKLSKPRTVYVENFKKIQKFSHVMHIVSNVKGELRDDVDTLDALLSVLPAGTLSGAPKIRAMEIIEELENVKRGPYGGAVGYFSYDQTCDFCITIRSFIFKDGYAYLQAGAGIVADSVPEKEYEETNQKARALIQAIEKAGK